MSAFPIEARVVLHGLVNAAELNGKIGIVKSTLQNGRQHVLVEELSKSVALKPSNLAYEERPIQSLSTKELKVILQQKHVVDAELRGVDKSELQRRVTEVTASNEEIAELLARANEPKQAQSASASTASSMSHMSAQAAEQLQNMSPEQLRQQAQMMRAMDPDSIRRMNPQLAHMTNAQIQQAIIQMEMMANNPDMVKRAAEQMKQMSPEQLQQLQVELTGGRASANMPAASAATRPTPSPSQAATMMANMTPDQLRQQAQMMKTMEPDQIRALNPQLAHMTDAQIQMAASQFEMMADNPEMMKMAMEQMKSMSPEDLARLQNQAGGAPPDLTKMEDPSKLLEGMDPQQLKTLLKSLKDNPGARKQFAAMTGIGEEQLSKGLDAFSEMDDKKLDAAIKFMAKAQKVKDGWTRLNAKFGGHLLKIIIGILLLVVYYALRFYWLRKNGTSVVSDSIPEPVPVVEDEFASGGEF